MMIRPPYPFPEQWAAVAERARRGDADAQRWMVPLMDHPQAFRPPPATYTAYEATGREEYGEEEDEEDEEEDEEEEEEDGECEYAYVLRDEWRSYLRETVLSDDDDDEDDGGGESSPRQRPRQRPSRTQPKPAAKRKPAPPPIVATPLALALEDARVVETQRQRDRRRRRSDRDAWQRVDSLETAVHARFEAFCDRHAPTVWPQGAS